MNVMIERYSDHAANERTFLAWVRTAIAIMAFGFLIERFNLFMRFALPQLARDSDAASEWIANAIGVVFLLMGIGITAIAAVRFFKTARQIDAAEIVHGPGTRVDLALAGLLVLLGCSLLLYLVQAVIPTH